MAYVKTINEDGVVSDIMAVALDPTLDATIVHQSEVTQATNVTTAGQVADARAIKTLTDAVATNAGGITAINTRLDEISTIGFTLPSGGSITLNVQNSARFMVMGTAPNTGVMFATLCATNGTGSNTTTQDLYIGSAISHTAAQGKFTIANSNTSHSPKCLCIMFSDTPTVSISS